MGHTNKKHFAKTIKQLNYLGDKSFVAHIKELIESPAWQYRSINCRKLIDRIEIEEASHAGKENGYLKITYDNFVKYGIDRKYIDGAIREAEELGLILVVRDPRENVTKSYPNKFTLNYLPVKSVEPEGYVLPNEQWKNVTEEQAKNARKKVFNSKIKKKNKLKKLVNKALIIIPFFINPSFLFYLTA